MLNVISNVEEFRKYVDDMLKLNFRSRYMINLYEKKKEVKYALSQEEDKDYLLHRAILEATSFVFSGIYNNFISTAMVSDNPKYVELINAKSKGIQVRQYDFGAPTSSNVRQVVTTLNYGLENLVEKNRNVVSQELVGMDYIPMNEKMSDLSQKFTPEEKREFMDKIMLAYNVHSIGIPKIYDESIICDKEYSKAMYPKDSEWIEKNAYDYRGFLAKYGIDMGELPKTFASENLYEQQNDRSAARR